MSAERLAPILALCLACGLRADSALDVHTLFEKAAAAMADRKAAAFVELFDPATPGFGRLRSQVETLLKTNDAESTIEWRKNEGDAENRAVQLNWLLEITGRNGAAPVTHRRAEVECKLAKKAGEWRIVSFTPLDFFAPPQAEQAWMVVMTAAQGLTEANTDTSANSGDTPAANTNKFMQAFDPALPGYAQLKDNVLALEQGADIESSVDLVQNDGDDQVRTIVVEWLMSLVAHDTSVAMAQRSETLTCRLEKRGKSWRITSLEPRSFFAPPGAGKSPPY
ncbi:MAG: hypothetical protein P4L56_07915 [Candidatus Sulfopaludibacter sp.]|nr:hypothetical protein [Candidatus Sulfopaludibacter sp.]